jgi:hypothetical protein
MFTYAMVVTIFIAGNECICIQLNLPRTLLSPKDCAMPECLLHSISNKWVGEINIRRMNFIQL